MIQFTTSTKPRLSVDSIWLHEQVFNMEVVLATMSLLVLQCFGIRITALSLVYVHQLLLCILGVSCHLVISPLLRAFYNQYGSMIHLSLHIMCVLNATVLIS